MRFLLAGALATLTAAGLAAIQPAVLTGDERAAALAIRENRMRADLRFLSGAILEGGGPGDSLARAYLASRFEAIGLEPGPPGESWEQPLERAGGLGSGARAIGLLRGRDPELSREAVVYKGALDDASGLAALLAVAEAYAALPERPRRSILFAAVAAEKLSLLGSDDRARQPPSPAGRLAAVFNLDDRLDLTPGGDFRGAVEDARLLFHVGAMAARAPLAQEWRPREEPEAARRRALAGHGR